jgi:hypothetical protein
MPGEEIIPGVGDGGAAVADAPADETIVDDAAAAGGADAAETSQADADAAAATDAAGGGEKTEPDLSDIETDGRKIDAKTRAEIAELKKTNPQAAKKWAESYFRNQAVMKEFPEAKTPGEAISAIRNMRATIESLGGEQGITELQTEVQDYRNEIQQFANGDKALIEQLYDPQNPQGLIRSTRNSLDVLRDKNIEHFDEAILPHFSARLEQSGLVRTVDNLLALVKEGKGQESYDLLGKIKGWLGDIKEKADNIGKSATTKNPEAEKLAKDREEFENQKKTEFQTRVETDVNRANNPELDKLINPLQKDLGLKKEGMNHFRNGLIARVWKVLANDKAYLNNVRSIRAKGDSVKTADYIHRAFIERLPEQFRLHRNEIYPNIGTKPKPAAGAQPNGEKKVVPINVTQGQRPRREQVDWVKTSDSMWIAGMAYLLDGKLVKGFKDAPANRY